MTILIAYKDHEQKRTWLGSDLAATTEHGAVWPVAPKWSYINGNRAIGASGWMRTNNLLEDHRPELFKYDTPREVAEFIREKYAELQHNFGPANGEERFGSFPTGNHTILYVDGAYTYIIGADFAVWEPTCDFVAIGSADTMALGALAALDFTKTGDIADRIKVALNVVCEYDPTIHDRGAVSFIEWPADE